MRWQWDPPLLTSSALAECAAVRLAATNLAVGFGFLDSGFCLSVLTSCSSCCWYQTPSDAVTGTPVLLTSSSSSWMRCRSFCSHLFAFYMSLGFDLRFLLSSFDSSQKRTNWCNERHTDPCWLPQALAECAVANLAATCFLSTCFGMLLIFYLLLQFVACSPGKQCNWYSDRHLQVYQSLLAFSSSSWMRYRSSCSCKRGSSLGAPF